MLRDIENLFEYKEEENYEKPIKVSNFWQKAIAINFLSSIYNDFEHIIIKKSLSEFIRPSPISIFDIYNPYGIKLLIRLRLGLCQLSGHKFKHGFNDTTNPIYICGGDVETDKSFLFPLPWMMWSNANALLQYSKHW